MAKKESNNQDIWQRALASGGLKGVYLLHGTEENLKLEALLNAKKALLDEGFAELNSATLINPTTDELRSACETIPFMADKRLVIVRDMDGLSGRREAPPDLLTYLPEIASTCVLIFYHSGTADGRKKLTAAIKKSGLIVTFEPLNDVQVSQWVQARFRSQGKECTTRTADWLVFISGRDTAVLQGEVDKLIAYIGDRGEVSHEDINAIATRTAEYNIFQLVEAAAAGNEQKAMRLFHALMVDGQDELYVLAMLLRQYRQMQQIKILQFEHIPQAEWQQRTGMNPYAMDQVSRQANGVQNSEIRKVIAKCLEMEYAVKSGKRSQQGCAEATLLYIFALKRGEAEV